MSLNANEAVRLATRRAQSVQEVIDLYMALHTDALALVESLRGELLEARSQLSRAYLPELSQDALDRAQQLTGFRGFSRRNPLEALAHQTTSLRKAIVRIEADERWQRRQFLVGPVGELTRALEEVESMLEPWIRDCERFEQQEGFMELLQVHYDTPEYELNFLHARYWRHWKQGDAICEALGYGDFGDEVLPAYVKVATERNKWLDQKRQAEARIHEVHSLVQQRDRAEQQLPLLPDQVLDAAIQQLVAYLEHADLALLESWQDSDAAGDRALIMGLRKCAGLAAKVLITNQLEHGLRELLAQLEQRRAKLARKSVKYARGKYAYTQIDERAVDPRVDEKMRKLRLKEAKLRKLMTRVERYEAYHRFELSNDEELWWHELSGGKRPPSLLRDTYRWYQRNPQATPDLDLDEAGLAQERVERAKAAAAQDEDLGYLS